MTETIYYREDRAETNNLKFILREDASKRSLIIF